MNEGRPAPRLRQTADVVRALQRARGKDGDAEWGGVTFLIGAGCSWSAEIPLGEQIARECVLKLAGDYSNGRFTSDSSDEALQWLQREKHLEPGIEWPQVYGELFQNHLSDPSEQQRIVRQATERMKGINWAHLCLGELVRARYVHTVLTTNFDQLVLEGIVRTGIIPVVADGIEALNRIDGRPANPQLVHLHGSRHTYHPRNSRSAVQETGQSHSVVRTLSDVLRSSPALVVVGYAGAEEGVMEVLVEAARELRGKTIFWAQHKENPEHLSPLAAKLLSHSPGGGLLVGQDADELFAELMRGVGLGLPRWFKQPVGHLQTLAKRMVSPKNQLIQREFNDFSELLIGLAEDLEKRQKLRGKRREALRAAREFALEGKDDQAVEMFEQAKGAFESWRDWMAYGDAAFNAGESAEEAHLLRRAVESYERALTSLSRESEPQDWAEVQNSLGIARARLGGREQEAGRLESSVKAFQAALEVYDPQQHEKRARTLNNLGNALNTLGEREEGTERLEDAVDAFRNALSVFTRDRLPLEWATTQNNLGNALSSLGEREGDGERLKQALAAYRSALEVRSRDRLPLEWATTQHNFGGALALAGAFERDPAQLREAVEAYRQALEVYTRARFPLDWVATQVSLGAALRALGELSQDPERLEEALRVIESVLEPRLEDRLPWTWAEGRLNLGKTLRLLGTLRSDLDLLKRAMNEVEVARDAYDRFGSKFWVEKAKSELEEIRQAIARLTT